MLWNQWNGWETCIRMQNSGESYTKRRMYAKWELFRLNKQSHDAHSAMEIIDKNKASLAESQMQKEIFEWSAKEMNNFTANATSTIAAAITTAACVFTILWFLLRYFFCLFVCWFVIYKVYITIYPIVRWYGAHVMCHLKCKTNIESCTLHALFSISFVD